MITNIILDFDGAVVNLQSYRLRSWKRAFNKFGLDFTIEEFFEYLHDHLREQGVRNILSDAKEDLIQRIADLKQTFYICNLNNNPPQPLPYFYEMIAELRQEELKICVAGSSRNTHFILEKMGIFSCFDAVVDRYCYDIQKVKPEPDIYLAAFKKLNCEPNSCAIVTNSVRGIKAAKKTGAKTIGISTTVSKENLASF